MQKMGRVTRTSPSSWAQNQHAEFNQSQERNKENKHLKKGGGQSLNISLNHQLPLDLISKGKQSILIEDHLKKYHSLKERVDIQVMNASLEPQYGWCSRLRVRTPLSLTHSQHFLYACLINWFRSAIKDFAHGGARMGVTDIIQNFVIVTVSWIV